VPALAYIAGVRPASRLASSLACILAGLVAAQTADLLPCADDGCGVWNVVSESGHRGQDQGGGEEGPEPDAPCCLCRASLATGYAAPVSQWIRVDEGMSAVDGLRAVAGPARRVPHPPPRG
jgi:hypothetical protein